MNNSCGTEILFNNLRKRPSVFVTGRFLTRSMNEKVNLLSTYDYEYEIPASINIGIGGYLLTQGSEGEYSILKIESVSEKMKTNRPLQQTRTIIGSVSGTINSFYVENARQADRARVLDKVQKLIQQVELNTKLNMAVRMLNVEDQNIIKDLLPSNVQNEV